MSNNDRIQEGGAFTGASEMFKTVFDMGAAASANMVRNEIVTVNDEKYIFDKSCGVLKPIDERVHPDLPHPDTLRFFTLDGLID